MRPEGIPIGWRLAVASQAVSAAFSAALAAEGGTRSSWLILSSLRGGRWSTQLDLARSLGIESPTLTRHLENLERAGFVHGRMLGAVIAFDGRLQEGVSSDDLRYLDHLLARLAANVRTTVLPPPV